MPDFKRIVLSSENSIKERVFKGDDVYTYSQLGSIINESKDWRQKLKNTTNSQVIHGDFELSSLNANNNIPVIGSMKSATVDFKTGGIIQGQIQATLLNNLINANQEQQIKDDLEALYKQAAYNLDDMIYGDKDKFKSQGIYGLVSNPQVTHDSTTLDDTYGNKDAEDILADLKLFISDYIDGINSDNTIRYINTNALDITVRVPKSIMATLRTKKIAVTGISPIDYPSVLKMINAYTSDDLGKNVTFVEDVGMDLISPQDGKGVGYKVLMIGIFSKNYMTLEIPHTPQRVGMQGKKTDWGFDIVRETASAAYTMQVLGTQIIRSNTFETRDV